ncbi:MAG: hypothetical protein LIP23_03920, partial [Planctomycetes bacterium]|nr:hypothetical protein [Planctomycetota bacterium]
SWGGDQLSAPVLPPQPDMPAPLPPPADMLAAGQSAAPDPFAGFPGAAGSGTTVATGSTSTALRPPAAVSTDEPLPTPLTQGPADLPAIPSFGSDISAPPLASAESGRPSNPRESSNHYARESEGYLKDGRADLALESATRALNEDNSNPLAYSSLAQAYVAQDEPNYARAAMLAKEATNLGRDWYSWWTCADVFYRWAHARNTAIQAQLQTGQRPAADIVDERNQALSNAQIAIENSAMLSRSAGEADRERVALTHGEIVYLRALTIPEPVRPPDGDPARMDEYRRAFASYRSTVAPVLQEALPYFQTAVQLGGPPSYREAFRLGIVNFRLGGIERESGNAQQATMYYEAAARYLEEATNGTEVPPEGPREAYYMLGYCHDQLAQQPGRDRARHMELAYRYWRQTAGFYPAGSAYRDYAEQRVSALAIELGR